jgi:hypothetical protein
MTSNDTTTRSVSKPTEGQVCSHSWDWWLRWARFGLLGVILICLVLLARLLPTEHLVAMLPVIFMYVYLACAGRAGHAEVMRKTGV